MIVTAPLPLEMIAVIPKPSVMIATTSSLLSCGIPQTAAGPAVPGGPSTSVVTRLTFTATPAQAWDTLMFYEQIEARQPLILRLLLPVPIRTEGSKSVVGDESRCLYEGGLLIKRITDVDRGRHLGFDITLQELVVGRGMTLLGGSYTLRPLPNGCTEVEVATRYTSPRRPRWLCRPLEAAVCHLFHRHVLRAMRCDAEQRPATTAMTARAPA
ncbi:MAG: hypothetical protein ABJC74_11455 [Gemmatimonadota bacterium]